MKPITEDPLEVARDAELYCLEEEGINPEHFGEEGSGWGSAESLTSAENFTEPAALMYSPQHVDYNDYIWMEGSG